MEMVAPTAIKRRPTSLLEIARRRQNNQSPLQILYRRTQMPLKALISSRARIFWEDGPPRTLYALLVGGGGAISQHAGKP